MVDFRRQWKIHRYMVDFRRQGEILGKRYSPVHTTPESIVCWNGREQPYETNEVFIEMFTDGRISSCLRSQTISVAADSNRRMIVEQTCDLHRWHVGANDHFARRKSRLSCNADGLGVVGQAPGPVEVLCSLRWIIPRGGNTTSFDWLI